MTIGIVGLGLIGGSIGLALRKPGQRILGFEPDPAAAKIALERQCIDELVAVEKLGEAEVIFLACPPSHVVENLENLRRILGPEIVITDCASVKGDIVAWAKQHKDKRFVPGHPMAGHEKTGATYSSSWLFRHARWILTPLLSTDRSAVNAVEKTVKEMGATPIRMNAQTHDRQVAILSHLPHALAAVLVQQGAELESAEIAAGSWKDLTRVGGVDPDLWTQIFLGNRSELVNVLTEAENLLAQLRSAIEDQDTEAIQAFLQRSAEAKSKHEPKVAKPIVAKSRVISRSRKKS